MGNVMIYEFIDFVEGGVNTLLKILFQYLLERAEKNRRKLETE
jgi:hypothetical protein